MKDAMKGNELVNMITTKQLKVPVLYKIEELERQKDNIKGKPLGGRYKESTEMTKNRRNGRKQSGK